MPHPTVSVVLPTWNRSHLLPRALESIESQTFKDWEIVLVDDGSTDDTPEVAAQYTRRLGDRLVVLRQCNQGAGAARNLGIDAARGSFVAFLDSDDEFVPNKLERQLALFELRPGLGFVYSDFAYVELDGTRHPSAMAAKWPVESRVPAQIVAPGLYDCGDGLFDALIRNYFIATIVGLVRKETLGKDIRFPTHLRYAEEWLFYLRVARVCRSGFVDEALSVHHATEGSVARTDKAWNTAENDRMLRAIQSAFCNLRRPQRAALRRQWARTASQLGNDARRRGEGLRAARYFAVALGRQPSLRSVRDIAASLGQIVFPHSLGNSP